MRVSGQKIRDARRARELTQDELAALVGRSGETIRRVELGHNQPRLSLLFDLSRALGVPWGDLLETSEEEGALA